MSITLFGLKPKDTYQALIKVGNNTNLDGTKKVLSDGLGNDLPMEVSTTEVNFTNLVKQGGVALPTASQVAAKQDILVSGSNIKTINGSSILGSGDITITTSTAWGSITGTLSAQTDLQTALNTKVSGNIAIVGATKTKVTYDSKGLVTSGADATTLDIADALNKRYVSDSQLTVLGNTSGTNTGDNATNTQYSGLAASKQDTLVSGTNIKTINSTSILGTGDIVISSSAVWGAITGTLSSQTDLQSALDSKQATLVSATNIKTINGSSVLGAGNLVVSASPSGIAGAVQFSDGSAFSSDVNVFKWDNTQKMLGLGVGAFAPSARMTSVGFGLTSSTFSFKTQNSNGSKSASFDDAGSFLVTGRLGVGAVSATASALFKGTGNTSATFSFQAENLAGTSFANFRDDGTLVVSQPGATSSMTGLQVSSYIFKSVNGASYINMDGGQMLLVDSAGAMGIRMTSSNTRIRLSTTIGADTAPNASAVLDVVSTTQGLLPPRMTTTQKNAIVTPASGLMVYDTTTNKLCCYNGTIWNDLF